MTHCDSCGREIEEHAATIETADCEKTWQQRLDDPTSRKWYVCRGCFELVTGLMYFHLGE